MRFFKKLLKYNLKSYLLTTFIFTIVWQAYHSTIFFQNTVKGIQNTITQNSRELEYAASKQDIAALKEYLWKLKISGIKTIYFRPHSELTEIVIGEISDDNLFNIARNYPLKANGIKVGSVQATIDLIDIQTFSFQENVNLLILILFSFLLLLSLANWKTIKTLVALEQEIEMANSDNLENVVGSHNEFTEFLRKYIKILREKSTLDSELDGLEYRHNILKEIAHGIKSPVHTLNVVKGPISEKLDDSTNNLFEQAYKRINHLANNILVQKHETTGRVNINMAIKKIISLKKAEYVKFKDININFLESSPLYATLAVGLLYEVLSNFINNAYEAIENDNGQITIKAYQVGQELHIECADNGKGIPPEILEKIWEKDFSFDKPQGSGIGLSQIKNIVEKQWSGQCCATSQKDIGSTFKFTIPLSK